MHIRPRWMTRSTGTVFATAGLVAMTVVVSACTGSKEEPVARLAGPVGQVAATSSPTVTKPPSAGPLTAEDLAVVARTRVFFGHQSVGMNVLDGVPGVFSALHVAVPPIVQDEPPADAPAGFISHAYIGENENPLLKIQDFDVKVRSGIGDRIDVAMMKFCYIDIKSDTDVQAIFEAYRTTMSDLERDYPDVTFVKATVPLMTEPGLLARTKARITGTADRYGAAENVARERLNALIRREYAGKALFDLAAIESTTPDGKRVRGARSGQQYFALHEGYASDQGHLNPEGARRAATAWLQLLARSGTR